MDTLSGGQVKTPAELVAAVPCPVTRIRFVTNMAAQRNGNLSATWAAQRRQDVLTALQTHTQYALAQLAAMTPQRMNRIVARARRECTG